MPGLPRQLLEAQVTELFDGDAEERPELERCLSSAFGRLLAAEALPSACTIISLPDALLPEMEPYISKPGAARHVVTETAFFYDRAGGAAATLDGTSLEGAAGVRFRLPSGASWPAMELSAPSRMPTRLRQKWQLLYQIDAAHFLS